MYLLTQERRKLMKNVKIKTKLIVAFLITDAFVILSLFFGYNTAKTIISVDNPQHYLQSYATFILISLIVMLIFMTYISISIIHSIIHGVNQLSNAAEEIANGKIDVELKKEGDDEFGKLIDAFQKVIKNTRYQAKVVEEISSGNMTVEVQPSSSEDVLGISLRKLVKQNHSDISNITVSAYQVKNHASQVASASEALAQGSTEQASAIEQITASINDIAKKTKTNAGEANQASQLIEEAISDVEKGNAQMQDMVVAMQDINKSSESISKIIKVIDDIAFQTNILALNAAVEAARAGEAGKGFAVVAEEVRSLAAKSSAAAAETAEMIEDSIVKVTAGSKIADETAKALAAISNVVKESETIILDIAEASNYQATAIEQIDQAIEQVSQVVQNNSATSEECAAASVELANQANKMRELLSVYELGDQSTIAASTNIDYQALADKNERIISLNSGFGKY